MGLWGHGCLKMAPCHHRSDGKRGESKRRGGTSSMSVRVTKATRVPLCVAVSGGRGVRPRPALQEHDVLRVGRLGPQRA